MKKLLILFLPIILFAQRPEGFRGTNGISMADIRIAIGDSNIVSLQGTTPDTAKIQGSYPLKLSGLRVTGSAKFESNVVMSTIAGEQIKAGAGTAALPQYSASADTNTGMYLDGADGLGLSTAGVQRVFVGSTGEVGLGTSTDNTKMTIGLNINQGAADDDIITLKSSDIATGLTSVTETDTYGRLIKHDATTGGLGIWGYTEYQSGLVLNGVAGSSSASTPHLFLRAYKSSGTNITGSFGASDYVFGIRAYATDLLMLLGNGKLGLGTTTPLNTFSLVDATSGQGTGLHVVSSQWNKARATWAAAHDTSSIMMYIDSAGGPRLSMKAVSGDSLGITINASSVSHTSTVSQRFYVGAVGTIVSSTSFSPLGNDAYGNGSTGNRWQNYWGSDNIYLGGKGQTATMTISTENVIAGTDSSQQLTMNAGNPEHIFMGANGNGWKITVGNDNKLSFYFKDAASWIKKASIDTTGAYTDEF